MRHLLRLTLVTALGLLLGLAVSQGEKVLIVAVPGDIDTFDPGFTVGSKPSQTTIQNTFDQLTQYAVVNRTLPDGTPYQTVDTSQILGMLAESYELADGGSTVIFHVRPGLTYSDGTPIDASAVVNGYRRIFGSGGISVFLLSMGGAVTSGDAFQVIDNLTLSMRMSKANNITLLNNTMHNTSALNPREIEAHATADDPWATGYFRQNLGIGNGPFVLEEYVPGDRIVLRARDDYYGDRAKLDRVIMKIISDPAQRELLLRTGAVDMVDVIPFSAVSRFRSDPRVQLLSIPTTRTNHLIMNNAIAPFDNQLVRQAVNYAIPYDLLLSQVTFGNARPARSPVNEGMPSSDYSFWHYDTNPDRARELLAQAGFPGGQGLPAIKLSVRIGDEIDERTAVIVQDALAQVGMPVRIERLAFAAFNQLQQAHQLQFFVDNWISWVNDPFYHLFWNFYSRSPTNYGNFSNARVDELIDTLLLSDDAAARDAGSREIQQIVIEEAPWALLYNPNFIVAMRKNVTGYVYYNDELTRFVHMDKN
ncbi:MAG: ABC transporter substrate-binding protein [Deinococcus sp.]|nr:ABC transporter substrate-binding protein [Deinococcus sp.]